MTLRLNISPCPNDTFMFDALLNGRIDSCGLDFEVGFYDIEELNRRVMRGEADVSKISYAVLPEIAENYTVLSSGSALGCGNGPLLVARGAIKEDANVAIPGEHTTANLLVQRLLPDVRQRTSVLFSEIAEGVAAGKYDAGVLIHEGRFTYKKYGLNLIKDLGVEWEKETGLPLPLGGIVASKRLDREVVDRVEKVIRESVEYALLHPEVSREFVKKYAREMSDEVIESHIGLFVNEFSVDLGEVGRRAIKELTGA